MLAYRKSVLRIRRRTVARIVDSRPISPIDAALMEAVKEGDVDRAYHLVLSGADVNYHKDDGITPLYLAAEIGHRGMVHFLVTQPGIDPNIRGKFGRTPIFVAASYGFLSASKMLLRHFANPNIGDMFGRTPLHRSILACNLPMTTLLVRYGADVNHPDDFGNMPLYLAMIEVRNPDQSRFLLRNGALPNLRGPRGNSILFDCVIALDPDIQNEVVHMLIRYGGRVNIGNPITYKTPLHSCAYFNKIELTKFLLKMGANPKTPSYNGILPIQIAADEKNWEICNELEDAIYELEETRNEDEDSSLLKLPSSIGPRRKSSVSTKTGTGIFKPQSINRVRFLKAIKARAKVPRFRPNSKGASKQNLSQGTSKGAEPSTSETSKQSSVTASKPSPGNSDKPSTSKDTR